MPAVSVGYKPVIPALGRLETGGAGVQKQPELQDPSIFPSLFLFITEAITVRLCSSIFIQYCVCVCVVCMFVV